jgi:hypothetical protein
VRFFCPAHGQLERYPKCATKCVENQSVGGLSSVQDVENEMQ